MQPTKELVSSMREEKLLMFTDKFLRAAIPTRKAEEKFR
jgi:hypothetical protein